LNLSLGLTVIGFGMNLWDGVEFSQQLRDFLARKRKARHLEQVAKFHQGTLMEINAELTNRLNPP